MQNANSESYRSYCIPSLLCNRTWKEFMSCEKLTKKPLFLKNNETTIKTINSETTLKGRY